ncbi:MAG: hypothetical protein O8C64_05400 [Candidatus Methanoperedens sp.]|nr:hypothetical protein [Candidatus Methanoperedens sp.]MCZ7406300.1 hypothetical protein [Candidatus Methanoperedens sp.]
MTDEDNFLLYADILGFSRLTLKEKDDAERMLKKYHKILRNLIKKENISKENYFHFSDSFVIRFLKREDTFSFSKKLFYETFDKKIPLRGTIGVGNFILRPGHDNKFSFTVGSGLVLSSIAEKYHVKGHILLLVCENKAGNNFEGNGLIRFDLGTKEEESDLKILTLYGLSKEFKAYIVPWWEKTKAEELKNEIDKRTHGLDVEKIIYLEKTKEHMNYFIYRDSQGDIDEW